jgi:hypothetical protein
MPPCLAGRPPSRRWPKIERDTVRDTKRSHLATLTTLLNHRPRESTQVRAVGRSTKFPHNPSGRRFEPDSPHFMQVSALLPGSRPITQPRFEGTLFIGLRQSSRVCCWS